MQYKVAELEGALLDAAVALALGLEFDLIPPGSGPMSIGPLEESPVRPGGWIEVDGMVMVDLKPFAPSVLDEHGGPIIWRERIELLYYGERGRPGAPWEAQIGVASHYIDQYPGDAMGGSTPLIAAMRAYVASKFGDTVELP